MVTTSKSTCKRWLRKRREVPSKPSSSLFNRRRVNRMRRSRKGWRGDLFYQLILSKVFMSNNFTLKLLSMDLKKPRARTTQRAIFNGILCFTLSEVWNSKTIDFTLSSGAIFMNMPSSSSSFYPGIIKGTSPSTPALKGHFLILWKVLKHQLS
jgi:hypothetical protein